MSAWALWFVVVLSFPKYTLTENPTGDISVPIIDMTISERQFTVTPAQLEELHSDLEIWLLLHSADVDKVVYKPTSKCPPSFTSTGGGCLQILQPVRPGELVLSVPRALILTAEADTSSPGARALSASSPSRQAFYGANMGVMYLHVLLAESLQHCSGAGRDPPKAPGSSAAVFFAPLLTLFLKTFPAHHFPLFWGEQNLSQLQGSDMLTFIDMHRQTIDSEYQCISEDYPAFSTLCSPQIYALIWVYVRANAFTMPAAGSPGGKTVGIVPLLDAIGHVWQGGATDGAESARRARDRVASGAVDIAFNHEKQTYEVRAVDSIAVGATLTKPLPLISGHKQLLTFGNCGAGRLFFWDQLQPHHPREAFFLHVLRLLLAAARRGGAEAEAWDWDGLERLYGPVLWELANEQQTQDPPSAAALPASSKDALILLLDIEKTCLHYLSGYSSSLEEDIERLSQADHAHAAVAINEVHALRLLRVEKRALHHMLSFARLSLELLHAPSISALQSHLRRATASSDQLVGAFLEHVVTPLVSAGLERSEEVLSSVKHTAAGKSMYSEFAAAEHDQPSHHKHAENVLTVTVEEFREQYDVCVQEWEACEDVLVEVDADLDTTGAEGSRVAALHRLLMDHHPPRAAKWPRLHE